MCGADKIATVLDKHNFVLDNLKNHDFVHDHACSGFTPFLSALPGGCRMNAPPIPSSETGLPIAAVERETGLAKDTLRVWEKRYGGLVIEILTSIIVRKPSFELCKHIKRTFHILKISSVYIRTL